MYHWTGRAAGAGRPMVVEVVAVAGSAALLVGRRNSLMSEFWSLLLLHGLGAVAWRRWESPCSSGLVAPSGTRGMGNPAAVKYFGPVPVGGLATGRCGDTHKQAGRQSTALTGASIRSYHVTKRFRILATLKQGNKSMYSNTSGYVHMGLRLDWAKGITGQ